MKAAFYEGNASIQIGKCTPRTPNSGEVQIRVSYCGICGTDLHIFHGKMDHRMTMPAVIGHEMSGTIEVVGPGVSGWSPGDRVTVRPLDPCGTCPACKAGHSHICQKLKFIGIETPGAMQGLWTVPAHVLHRLPHSLSMKHGALVEPLAVACHDVRLGAVKPGEYVVVLGGGPIGALVALVAQAAGARVVVSEVNPFRVALARDLGIEVVNPLEMDLPALVEEQTGGAGADVVFEVSGSKAGAAMMTKLPRARGRIVVVAIYSEPPQVELFKLFWREIVMRGARVYEPQDFEAAIELAASGKLPLDKIITNICPLDELETQLHQLEKGGAVMKILLECS
ncbi:MAG TPA: alcohol dehydrogenase catalytic domain-containing protein [Acidimicrobiales bacterium]|nr:alcohol dehydrogenase catalytic domain-containing protein [Acidimicrobiales bacterium]